ncbi:TPA: YadA-like family protein [Stenotrophomonas maltophilia]
MNKIYRRLWSTARQCWVVASELTSPRGKASSTVGASALVLAMAMLPGVGVCNAHAYYYNTCQNPSQYNCVPFMAEVEGSQPNTLVTGSRSYMMLGMSSYMDGSYSTMFGNWSRSVGNNNAVFGFDTRAKQSNSAVFGARSEADGNGAVAVGTHAYAHGDMSIAMGYAAKAVEGGGVSRIAIGNDANAGTSGWTGAVAIGGRSKAEYDSLAVGYEAKATAVRSVALGRGSVATETDTVSVGNAAAKSRRRIVNVADGVVNSSSFDAVNGRQLQQVIDDNYTANNVISAGSSLADKKAFARGNLSLAVGHLAQSSGTAALALGHSSYAGANNAISLGSGARAQAIGSVALGGNTRAIHTESVALGEGSETSGNRQVSVGSGSIKRRIINVNDGDVSATSSDAITGKQLHATNQRIDSTNRAIATSAAISEANKAVATGAVSLAIGNLSKATGDATTAVGHQSQAEALNGVAMGASARAVAKYSVALGSNSVASHERSVALGEDSVTTGVKQVSVGNATLKRKIVNVDDGAINANSSEAVTGKQMYLESQRVNGLVKQASAAGIMYLGAENTGNVLTVSNKDGGKRYVNGVQNATLSASSSDAVTGQQLFATNNSLAGAQRVADEALGKVNSLGGLISGGPTGGMQLGAENNGSELSVRNKSGWRRVISGVHNADLSAGSTEAVTGQQLYATNNNVATAKLAADSALGKANTLSGLVSQVAADGNVRLGGENTGTVLDVRNKANANRTLSGLKDGAVNGTSTEAVTGKQLNTTNTEVAAVRTVATAAQTAANTAKTTADNALGKANTLGGLVSQVAADGNVRLGGENTGAVLDVRNKANANRTLSGLKDGAVSATSTEAVTGKQLNTTNTEVASVRTVATAAQTTANTAKTTADNALGKANTLGGLVSQVAADGNVRLGGENTGSVLDVRNKSGGARSLSGLADGTISATSTEAVTGKQLQATHDRLATAQSRADAAHAGATAAQTTANQAKAKADATGNAVATSAVIEDRNRATATGNLAMAMGQAAKANGVAAFAMGHSAVASGNNAVSVGSASAASARSAVALGGNAKAKHENSVALGERSETSGNDEVSVGNAATDLKRRIVNVEDARLSDSSTDAVTGKQLFATNEKVEANEGVLAGHTSDLAAQSGRIADNRRELDALRSEFEDFDPDLDGVVKFAADGSVDIAGGKLRGVAAGDISSAASTDAVNGGQLFVTNSRISGLESDARLIALGRETGAEAAQAGDAGVAIGNGAQASLSSEGGTAVGAFSSAMAANSVALGRGALVRESAVLGFALGAGTEVNAEFGAAIGAYAVVGAAGQGSVALGSYSEANEPDVVSIGNSTSRRRIINVDRGRSANEGATVAQVGEAVALLGGGASVDGNGGIIAPTYYVQGGTQNNVGDALAALDSAVVTADSRVDNLEGKLRSAFQDGPSVRADGQNQLVLAGANGSVLTNLADGRIAAGSRDAVTGSQLFDAKQEIARNRNDLNDLRGERDGLLSRELMAAEQGNVIDFGGARLTGVADGVISANSRDVVSGRQLFVLNESLLGLEAHSRFFKVGYDKESSPANAGLLAVAIGDSAQASLANEGGTAVGSFAKALGLNSVALGRGAAVSESATSGFALGSSSRVDGNGSVAIGAQAWVTAKNSVALGYGSRADEEGTVSVGNASVRRRIVNVANGSNATDAATVGQLRGALATLGGDVDANGNIINPTFNVQGGQQSTLNEALSSLDSAVVTNTTRTERVESQLRAVFQDSPSVRSDGLNQLTFAGANGMVLSNVANGAIAAGSRDAVNGGQLHSMQQQLNGRMDGLEQRIDGQPQAPQSRALTVAAVDSAASSTPAATPAADEPVAPPPSSGDNKVVADAGNAPKSSPQPQADAPKPESPKPQVDTAELEKMLARANEYSDGISREVDARLDKMDKRFNRMAAMTSAQSAMAMNTAGLNTYNRLGAGVGYSDGESAMAVGYQRVLNDKGSATFSLNGAFTNSGERSMGVGVGIGW